MIPDHRPSVRPAPEFPVCMVVLDIDGTLVGSDLQIGPRTRAAVAAALERGVHVSLATGRTPNSAVVFANQLGLSTPLIGHQGAAIRAMPKRREAAIETSPSARGRVGRLLHHAPLSAAAIREAIAWCRANGLDPHVNNLERIMVWAGDPSFSDYSAYLSGDVEIVADLVAAIRTPMSKVIAVGEAGRPMALVDEARRHFAGRADVTVSHPRFLEFVAPGVSKGRAVAWLAHEQGIAPGQVLAIGDSLNDAEMIGDAGHGAAMPTAVAAVRRVARYVAPPVADEGAAVLIERLVLAPPAEAARNAERLALEAADALASLEAAETAGGFALAVAPAAEVADHVPDRAVTAR
ncbi:MAG: HAD-IIB family hydrolase [Candidatus Limnocylindrales bacterium]